MSGLSRRTEVLVVGAGPVGLMTALLLVRRGVEVTIVDQAWRTAGRSYAAALHPATLALLEELGMLASLLPHTRRVDRILFHEGNKQEGELDLGALASKQRYVAVVPQSRLEAALEAELSRHEVPVHWCHRVASTVQTERSATCEVDVLEQVPAGYAVAAVATEVSRTLEVTCDFLVGADGHHSMVRRTQHIPTHRLGGVEVFDVFEFESTPDAPAEAGIVIDETTTNVLWTLPGRRQRWSFQVAVTGGEERDRVKSRLMMAIPGESSPRFTAEYLERLVRERAPWFHSPMGDIAWAGDVAFERRLADKLGKGRIWLVGDAVHQTSPIGIQSMNVGLLEARDLAERLAVILKEGEPLTALGEYERRVRENWECLLGKRQTLTPGPDASEWVRARYSRIVPCLPGSGDELGQMAAQLGLVAEGQDRGA